ncbi:hypothetical protein JJQ72_11465 [Paenibacillus sp. F411]|uniref:hypothetical protein n=1 Tax=Paenibacillus sp. F411 TaxID=2820239 RepID=UPI001AB00CD5|nr:hypothetical protein [Paenibacillus sp. F411]MBO2944588.1 hypothetical protein [Paenibacillus sp. F411]
MRRLSIILKFSLAMTAWFGLTGAEAASRFDQSTTISTWLWDTATIVEEEQQETVISNLVSHHVDVLQLQIQTDIQLEVYQRFIRKAHAAGIAVHALDGSPYWADRNGPKLQQAFLSWLTTYQNQAAPEEKFKGIHLDVEPYGHDKYEQKKNMLWTNYQTMMLTFKDYTDQHDLVFEIDIPFWLYGIPYNNQYGKGNVAEWVCGHVKHITIMAYRDTAFLNDGVAGVAAAEMKLFRKYGVQGVIAVETGKLPEGNDFVTFYGDGKEYMYGQLEQVYQKYKKDPAFHGIAIHHYESWMEMK